ncbi:MAG: hypothetical protein ABIL58_03645 [Pseudomonadota bacterium]
METNICPKCSYRSDETFNECPKCGIIVEKFLKRKGNEESKAKIAALENQKNKLKKEITNTEKKKQLSTRTAKVKEWIIGNALRVKKWILADKKRLYGAMAIVILVFVIIPVIGVKIHRHNEFIEFQNALNARIEYEMLKAQNANSVVPSEGLAQRMWRESQARDREKEYQQMQRDVSRMKERLSDNPKSVEEINRRLMMNSRY